MSLSRVHIRQLIGLAGIGGVVCGSIALYLQRRADNHFRNHPLIKKSKELLESNSQALDILGRPVKYPGGVSFNIETIKTNETGSSSRVLHLKIPYLASNSEGHLKVEALSDPLMNDWVICSLKAQVETSRKGEETPIKSLVIYKIKSIR